MAMEEEKAVKEGHNLLGSPTYEKLENGRFKCVETGHETSAKDMESYGQSKKCRLGLIDASLSQKKPPLNLFKQDPLSRSKLKCKLTGDTINKSEEHIWKHINGKRFLNKLEQKELEKISGNGTVVEMEKKDEQVPREESKSNKKSGKDKKKKKKKKKKNKKEKEISEIISEVSEPSEKDSDSEEAEFWMPPEGSRWDNDDGGDRWGSGSDSEEESDEDGADEEEASIESGELDVDEEASIESGELSTRTKRMSIEIGPSSFASRKKKSKTDSTC